MPIMGTPEPRLEQPVCEFSRIGLSATPIRSMPARTEVPIFQRMEGNHWGEINDGLLGATVVYSIAVDENSTVYATTPSGIFKLGAK